MGAYSYKDVMYRDDFQAAIKPAMESCGRSESDYDGDANYDGDGWVVAAFLLGQKDAALTAERERADRAEAALAAARQLAINNAEGAAKAVTEVAALRAQVARLVGAIEDAPHEYSCTALIEWNRPGRGNHLMDESICNCWKRTALVDERPCGECHLKPGERCNICGALEGK